MHTHIHLRISLLIFFVSTLLLAACRPFAVPVLATSTAVPTSAIPDWFNIRMTDVRTGRTFSMNDFAGKVVLLETMATWCATCLQQQIEVKKLEGLTGNSKDLVHISLDTDLNEDAATLKKYANAYGFDWYFAISPLEIDRALSNLYSGEFMNPPFAPMLFIDRQGGVNSLPWGLKGADALQKTLAPYLAQ
jgi:thiol-disulfide isomerase/thioredoxin